jgi:DNA polymerase (family 10)
MSNKEIVRALRLITNLMELHDENPFKIKSYSFAQQAIERCPAQLSQMSLENLYSIKGIGRSIGDVVWDLLTINASSVLDNLLNKTPEGIVRLLMIKGLGPKKIKSLWQDLGIESVGELLYACNENRLIELKGFGEKTQNNIKQSIEYVMANAGKFKYATLEAEAQMLLQQISQYAGVEQVQLTGAMRRRLEVVENIAFVVCCPSMEVLLQMANKWEWQGISVHDNELHGYTPLGAPVALYCCSPDGLAAQLFRTTATTEHLEQFLALGSIPEQATDEAAIYATAQLPYILPEWREGRQEIRLAQQNQLPTNCIRTDQLRGIIHAHTTYSDGQNTLLDMAQACIAAGYEYLGVSDHSKSAFYAGGLYEEKIAQQQREIDRLNEKLAPFKIYKGIESDILSDGSLDYASDVLASFDFIIASVHSNLKMTEEKAMSRLLKAIENPYTTILGHPTGRLLLSRAGYPIDHRKIIDACADNKVVIELNASPYRLDIDWRWIDYCMERGVPIAINPDAHSITGIEDVRFGVYVAHKAMLPTQMTFNAWSCSEIETWLAEKKQFLVV